MRLDLWLRELGAGVEGVGRRAALLDGLLGGGGAASTTSTTSSSESTSSAASSVSSVNSAAPTSTVSGTQRYSRS